MVVRSNGMRYATNGKHAWWTTTWERGEKSTQRKIDSVYGTFGNHGTEGPDKRQDVFNKIVDRVKKKHPEMRNVQARLYARKKDPLGRKFQRLKDSGYSAGEISKRLFGQKGRASTGSRGG